MAGLLTHLSIVLVGILLSGWFFEWKYGLIFGLGHLTPDLFDFGITGVLNDTLSPSVIMTYPLFHTLAKIGHNFANWGILAIVILGVAYMLYRYKKISWKTVVMISWLIAAFLIGIFLHIIFDALIIETNHWI